MKKFNEFYNQLKEASAQVPDQSLHAGEDLSSKAAVANAPDGSKKHKQDFEPKGPGKVDVPVAGKDYTSGKA